MLHVAAPRAVFIEYPGQRLGLLSTAVSLLLSHGSGWLGRGMRVGLGCWFLFATVQMLSFKTPPLANSSRII